MVFQKVLKGISGLDRTTAMDIVQNGLVCNWWRHVQQITPQEIKLHLNSRNADLHLNHYHKKIPADSSLAALSANKFGDVSPFISTTAGTYHRDEGQKQNVFHNPFIIALKFATKNFTTKGHIFYAYLLTIGKVAIEMEQFSEEIRELHVYNNFLPYHDQGEIMAKIHIPSVQIEKVEEFDGLTVKKQLDSGCLPTPLWTFVNPDYQAPEKLSNIREVLS